MKHKDGVYTEVMKVIDDHLVLVKQSEKIIEAKLIADCISIEFAEKEIVVTSILDGKHSIGSKHYDGNAFDMRISHYKKENGELDTELIQLIYENIKDELGSDYDVIYHKGSHIHIEYDPK